jgi:geranylgeranyl pyrophosphate synthase
VKGFALNLAAILEPIQPALERVERRLRQAAASEFPPLVAVIDQLLAAGGKRLRPAMVILGAGFHPVDDDRLISLASAVEMLHTATLVHDDMIDGAMVRRGHPTVNSRWSAEATVLAGDFLFAKAALLAAASESVPVVRIFSETLGTICDGELRQLLGDTRWSATRKDYYLRIYSKTASLFAGAAETGALLSGAPAEEVAALREYGHNLGMAFQIVDDVLDYTGDSRTMGKPVGSDLKQGIVTLPAIVYMENLSGDNPLDSLRGSLERQGAEATVRMILEAGCGHIALSQAAEFVDRGKAALVRMPDSPMRRTMMGLADFVVGRNM